MADERKRPLAMKWLFCVVAICALIAYFAYYVYGPVVAYKVKSGSIREYAPGTYTNLFIPAAWVEAQITGRETTIFSPNPDDLLELKPFYQATPIRPFRKP